MKKIFNIAIFMAFLTLVPACHYEIDDVFDQSSAIRIQEEITRVDEILKGAENGWLIEYYGATKYGGYNIFCKFNEDNTALAQSETYGIETATSHYKLEQSQGVVLSFDEYNKIIHYFSNPANPDGIGTDGEGMLGDFEFRVIEANSDMVVLKGKKHGSKVIMKPVAKDVTWNEYLEKVKVIEAAMSAAAYKITVGEQSVLATANKRLLTYTDTETGAAVNIPFIVTDKGYLLYNEFTFFGTAVTEFIYSVEDEKCYSDEAKTVTLEYVVTPLSEAILGGAWYLNTEETAELVNAEFIAANAACKDRYGVIAYCYLGTKAEWGYANDGWGLNLRVGVYVGQIYFEPAVVDEDTITLTPTEFDGNGGAFYNSLGFKNGILCFAGTFDLTTDDMRSPSWIKMQNTANPDLYITLDAEMSIYPYGQ